jgi:hypothetical protein
MPSQPYEEPGNDDNLPYNVKRYQELVGSLLYASAGTRPDIARAVSIVCSHARGPTYGQYRDALRVLQYLKTYPTLGLTFTASGQRSPAAIVLSAYADSSLAPDWQQGDGYSVSGYVVYLGGGPILWHSGKQSAVAQSSAECEYRALTACCREVAWLRTLVGEMGFPQLTPTTLYEDNTGAIGMANATLLSRRTRGIVVECEYLRECVRSGMVQPEYVSTLQQRADGLTKVLPSTTFANQRPGLMGNGADVSPAASRSAASG